MSDNFYQLFEYSPLPLARALEGIAIAGTKPLSVLPCELLYVKGLLAYLTGDTETIVTLLAQLRGVDSNPEDLQHFLYLLLERRLWLRKRDFKSLQNILEVPRSEPNWDSLPSIYRGEYYFVTARAWEFLKANDKAAIAYEQAAKFYQMAGLKKKQLKSLFNETVCREHFDQRIALKAHQTILHLACQSRDRCIAGITLNNLAFQLLFTGAYESARQLLDHSLFFLRDESQGLNYQLTQINYLHLYLLLGFRSEFLNLKRQLEKSVFSEIQIAIEVLSEFELKNQPRLLTQGWLWRLQHHLSTRPKLSGLEDSLLGYLALAPRSRSEILAQLWPGQVDSEAKIGRFKNLLVRLNQKRPGILFYEESKYQLRLAEPSLADILRNDLRPYSREPKTETFEGDEQKIRELLQHQTLGFYELLEVIYKPNAIDERIVNKLKNLIYRVRKKCPGQLVFSNGKYRWV